MKLAKSIITITAQVAFVFTATATLHAHAEEKNTPDKEMIPTEALILETASKPPKRGGSSSSIGADSVDERMQTGWFYGTAPIQTCYNALSNFGVSNSEIEKTIKRSLKLWADYFARKILIAKTDSLSEMPNLNFKFKGKCKGDEDLVFYFGAGPIFSNKQDLKTAQTLQSPLAYANKTQMRRDLAWSKGYIRFVNHGEYSNGEQEPYPNWRKPKALDAVLIHEIGHVLGFAHTPNTIMSASIMEQVFQTDGPIDVTIDQKKQLITCETCTEVYVLDKTSAAWPVIQELGLDPKRKIEIFKNSSQLMLLDGRKKVEIVNSSVSKGEAVQTLFLNFKSPHNTTTQSANIYGQIRTKDKAYPVILEYNSIEHRGGIVLRRVSDSGIEMIGTFRQ